MILNDNPGKLIVLEGLDGAGTTTQTRILAEALRARNIRVWTTREPSEGPIGAQIRSVLTRRLSMGKNALTALFTADRLDHLYAEGGVQERLARNEWVIMDRYYLSSFAYQALGMDDDHKRWLFDMHQYCIQPDLTIFVDVEAKISMERIAVNRGFHFELFETQDKLQAIREQYLKAITGLHKRGEVIHIIPGNQTLDEVQKNIWKRVKTRFIDQDLLNSDGEKKVFQDFPLLKNVRFMAEEEFSLEYQGMKDVPPSQNVENPTKGNSGAYQLEFLDEKGTGYHFAAYLNSNRARIKSIRVLAKAGARDIQQRIQQKCDEMLHKNTAQQRLIGVEP